LSSERPPDRRRAASVVAAALIAVAASAVGAGIALAGGSGAAAPPAGSPPAAAASALPAVPVHGAYLGVDPNLSTGDAPQSSLTQRTTIGDLATLQAQIGRPVTVVSFYIGWEQAPPMAGMATVAAQGSIPLVSWHCGPLDTSVANGQYDGLIREDAEAFKSFARPMFLRWFWEMNLPNVAGHPACLGTGDLQTSETEYVAAFQRIWTIFKEVGADNVAFVWSPSAAASAPVSTGFYPGNQYVDWLGFDFYDRCGKGGVSTVFTPTYQTYATATYAKPMMITETGAAAPGANGSCGTQANSPTQQQWLQQLQTALPSQFPDVHGVVYVDASDSVADYDLSGAGLAAFTAIGRTSYFAQVTR
jgi:hypothetical protein